MVVISKIQATSRGIVQRYGLKAWGELLLKLALSLAILEIGTRGLLAFKGYLDRDLPLCYDFVTVRCRTPEYYAELTDVIQFDSLTGIGHRPNYRGKYINTNSQGFRGIVEYGKKSPGMLRVVMIGGSAVWGPFIHDNETIPAYLQDELETQLGQPVEVINAGVTAERSFEELLRLQAYVFPLKPDVVVVYDGRNDLYFSSAANLSLTKTPAIQDNETLIQQKQRAAFGALVNQAWQTSTAYSRFLSTLNLLYSVWNARQQTSAVEASHSSPSNNGSSQAASTADDERGALVLAAYETNHRHMALLMKSENILPVFALQAVLQPDAKPLSPEETIILERIPESVQRVTSLYPRMQDLFATFGQTQSGLVALDYTDIFANTPEQMYFDDVHYLPAGNKLIAHRLAEDIIAALKGNGE